MAKKRLNPGDVNKGCTRAALGKNMVSHFPWTLCSMDSLSMKGQLLGMDKNEQLIRFILQLLVYLRLCDPRCLHHLILLMTM